MKSLPFIAVVSAFLLGMSSLPAAEAVVKSFSPSSDQAQSLGTASNRWETVYSRKINDGEGNEIDVGEAAAAIGAAQARDHAALTVESRAAADAHPIAAISGLAAILQPAAADADGLMTAADKSKLDDIDHGRLVYKNQNGDIRLDARTVLLGVGIDGSEHSLIRLSPDGSVSIGDSQVPLTLRASERLSVKLPSGQAGEKIAYLSDLAPYVSMEQVAGSLAAKADLVDGAVPLPQLPPQAVAQLWEVDALSGLTGLAEATAGDFAKISGGSEQGHVYILAAADPSRLENWIDLAEDVVVSVNGKNGAISLGLADLPDAAAALAGKAPLASPALTGTPTAPTPAVSDNTDKIATTAFVKKQGYVTSGDLGVDLTSYAKLNSPALTGTPTAPTPVSTDNSARLATTAFVREATNKSSGAIVGEIRLLPFRKEDLPAGWYYPGGDYFALTSAVGSALAALPANYKADWGIVVSGQTIRLFNPEKFFAGGNLGRFMRAADGVSRRPGSTQDDAIRNITGTIFYVDNYGGSLSGAFNYEKNVGGAVGNGTIGYYSTANFDASRVVPTAGENRPYEVSLTPAVYLGV